MLSMASKQARKDEPVFPLRMVWKESGEVDTYDDHKDLIGSLEDYDSDDPSDRSEAEVTDALGRSVHLRVKIWFDVCDCRLEEVQRP